MSTNVTIPKQSVEKSPMAIDLVHLGLSDQDFQKIGNLVHKLSGIRLSPGKEGLVKARLMKRLRALNLSDFTQYLDYVEKDSSCRELSQMIDELTTNKTNFFREDQHFEYLRNYILPRWREDHRELRIWSAGCSTGEEPFTIGIVLREALTESELGRTRILATDLSQRVLQKAKSAVYSGDNLQNIAHPMLIKYFSSWGTPAAREYKLKDEVRNMVRFARLNLMDQWPMKGPFEIIFCRNVMIYFDKPTQQKLIQRFWDILENGGHLFVGHSESLMSSSSRFKYIQPAAYTK